MNFHNNKIVLVVNDTPDQLEMMEFILRQAGYSVLTATDGREGYEAAQKHELDLIISDVMMPISDGIDLCRLIRADEKLRTLPILLVSARRKDTQSVVEGLETGADDYIESPYEPLHLIARAARLIERKKMEDLLRQSERHFRSVTENVSDVISIISPDGTIIYESPSLETVLGYNPDEVIGKSSFELIHRDDRELAIDFFKNKVQKSLTTLPIEYRFRKSDGSWAILESVGKYIDDPEKGLVAVVNSRDITQRKQIETAFRTSQNQLQIIFENAAMGIALVNAAGIPIHSNPALHRMLGYTGEDLRRMSFPEFTHPDDVDKDWFLAQELFTGKRKSYQIEKRYIKKNGEFMWANLTASIIPEDNGKLKFCIGMVEDITDRKFAEVALRESEEKFKAQYKGLPIPTYTWWKTTDDFVLVDYNSAAENLPHSKISGMSGITASKFYNDMPVMIENFNRCFDEKTVIQTEMLYTYRTTGESRYLDISYVYVPPDIVMVHTRDITGQREAEKAKRESDEAYRIVAETASDAIIKIADDNTILFINQAGEKIFGYKVEEMIGQPLTMLMPTSLRPTLEEGVYSYLTTGRNSVETYALHAYGHRFPLEISFGEHQEGKHFFIGIARDITERKRAEELQRQNEEWLAAIFEASQDGIAVEENEKVVFVNKCFLRMYGFDDAREVIGNSITQLQTPEDNERVIEYGRRRMQGEQAPTVYEFKGISKTGEILDLEASISTFTSNGKFYIVSAQRDITERKKAEEAVLEANQRALLEYEKLLGRIARLTESLGTARDLQTIYRALYIFAVNSVPCTGFFVSLYDAARDVRIPTFIYSDGEEIDVSGFPEMGMTGSPNSRAVASGKIIIEDDFQATMAGKPIVNIGIDKNPNPSRSCLVAPMSVMGRIVGAIEVQSQQMAAYGKEHATAMQMAANLAANAIENVRLLEQERQKDEQLRQAQKLESVGRLAGGIAHDFNNMLTAINGYSDLLLRKINSDDPLRQNVIEIKKAGERSASLTHQLLAFSRQQILQSKVIDLNDVVLDTIKMLQRLIGEDVHLITRLDPMLDQIEADPGQLVQVIMNLAVNARDAMPKGGNLTIETKNVYIDEEFAAKHIPTQPGMYVLLSVTDTGIGISEEGRRHIFEPFYTTKDIGKGTGLGLATVYGIVKQSDGYIWVDSDPGAGAAFKIYLPPVRRSIEAEEVRKPVEESSTGTGKILLVEDEEMVRNLSREVLEACGYEVTEAINGVEALNICRQTNCSFDLLMTDVVMPQMGGRELAEKMAQMKPEIKVLFTSGYTDDSVFQQSINEKGINFIQKPFTFDSLAGKIRKILEEKE
jgi:PAS domain S-box-containing protein